MPRQNGVGHDNRAGVDKGIVRDTAIVLELNDGIEGRARRLAPDALQRISPTFPSAMVRVKTFEILWIEKLSSASPAVKTTIDARHRDTEFVGVQFAQLWDVVGKASLP